MLQQAVKRVHEIERNEVRKLEDNDSSICVSVSHCQGPMIVPYVGKQFHKIRIGKSMLSRSCPDNVVILNDSTMFEIVNIVELNDKQIILIGITFLRTESFFKFSFTFNIY